MDLLGRHCVCWIDVNGRGVRIYDSLSSTTTQRNNTQLYGSTLQVVAMAYAFHLSLFNNKGAAVIVVFFFFSIAFAFHTASGQEGVKNLVFD